MLSHNEISPSEKKERLALLDQLIQKFARFDLPENKDQEPPLTTQVYLRLKVLQKIYLGKSTAAEAAKEPIHLTMLRTNLKTLAMDPAEKNKVAYYSTLVLLAKHWSYNARNPNPKSNESPYLAPIYPHDPIETSDLFFTVDGYAHSLKFLVDNDNQRNHVSQEDNLTPLALKNPVTQLPFPELDLKHFDDLCKPREHHFLHNIAMRASRISASISKSLLIIITLGGGWTACQMLMEYMTSQRISHVMDIGNLINNPDLYEPITWLLTSISITLGTQLLSQVTQAPNVRILKTGKGISSLSDDKLLAAIEQSLGPLPKSKMTFSTVTTLLGGPTARTTDVTQELKFESVLEEKVAPHQSAPAPEPILVIDETFLQDSTKTTQVKSHSRT